MSTKEFTITLLVMMATTAAMAQEPIKTKHLNLKDGIAIQGYDPVAYVDNGKAIKGKPGLAVYHQGATYYFVSVEHKDLFKKNAGQYEPAYGGWCAYAMGYSGEKVSIDPATFKIINGRLYLFYNKFFNNTLKDWNKDEVNLKSKADISWGKILKQ